MKKPKYFKLTLKALVDEEGDEFSCYDFNVKDEDDLEWPWMHGVKLKDPPTGALQLAVNLDDEDAGDFADFTVSPIPMVTQRFRNVLDAVGVTNVDYYPVTIDGADRFREFPTYFAANIVGKVAAADKSASQYTEAFGGPGATVFDELVLDPNFSTDLPIFILAENMSIVIVSEKVKAKAEALGVDTLRFIPL